MHKFNKFILSWNSTCFGQFVCPSSGVYSLYAQQWYMPYRFVDSFWAEPGWNCILEHLVGFITKKFVTMHGHMNVKTRNDINCDDGTYAISDRVIRILLSAKVLLLASMIRITATLFDVLGCSDIVHDGYKKVLVGEWTCVLQERC